jgi:ADP-ribosylglycohydrolase
MPPTADADLKRGRFRGALLGLAAGDALGTTLEFKPPGTFEPVDDMVGGGPFGLEPGQWTDDASMALCLAESLVESGGFDPRDQMARYVRWWRDGHLSSTGGFFDIGATVAAALRRFEDTGDPYAGSTDPQTAGNGALMRLGPVPMFFAADARTAVERAADSSRTTHGAATAVDACRYMAGLIVGALAGVAKDELLAPRYSPVPGLWEERPLAPEVDEVAAGSFLRREPPEIEGSGYVVRSLEAALWAFARGASFREGALLAVNLGHDADTTGAVYGQLAGACYGVEGIPAAWRAKLALRATIEELADGLFAAARPSA